MLGLELFIHHIRHLPWSQAKTQRKGRRLWLVLPRGPAKLRDQERMMRRPRPDLARSVLLRSVIGRGVVSVARLLERVIVNVKCKACFGPTGNCRGHV